MQPRTDPVILNVDDNEMCRYALTRLLQRNHFQVKEACNGADALRLAKLEKPDLVLLDVNLPDINGFEVCRRLKSEPETSRIPVLHVTASYVRGPDITKGLEGGADSYLVEPVDPEVLVATVNSVLRARRAEEAARAMAREWQATFNAIADGVAVVDVNGDILHANETLCRLLGHDGSDVKGMPCAELWPGLPADKQPYERAMKNRRRESIELEYDARILDISVDPMFDEDGEPVGAVHIVSDITEKRQLEEQFRESQKLESIGTLAAGVAHDFNNLLTGIMGNASLVLSELTPESDFFEKLQDVVSASERAADLTHQLLAYSGKGRHHLQTVDLSAIVRNSQNLIEAAIPKKVTLRLRLGHALPSVNADPTQVQQILVNLLSNAAEAIDGVPGTIEVSTGFGNGFAYLEVQDSGCGMDSATKARMFDPFFTTKFTGRGLGLAAVAGIVRIHKASIQVTSAPGQGSTIRISFPVVEAPKIMPRPAARPESAEKAGASTILVVDDEEMVRRIAVATLELRGYKVLQAKDGLEAIRQVRQNPQVSLVLLDLTMPVMSGEEAVDQILEASPGIKVLVSTGYDHKEAVARFHKKQVTGFIQKPYTSRQLGDAVRGLLQDAAGQR